MEVNIRMGPKKIAKILEMFRIFGKCLEKGNFQLRGGSQNETFGFIAKAERFNARQLLR